MAMGRSLLAPDGTTDGATIADSVEHPESLLVGHVRGVRAPTGSVLGWSAYSAGRVVDRLPAASPIALTPSCVHGGGTGLTVPGHPQDSVIVGSSARVRAVAP